MNSINLISKAGDKLGLTEEETITAQNLSSEFDVIPAIATILSSYRHKNPLPTDSVHYIFSKLDPSFKESLLDYRIKVIEHAKELLDDTGRGLISLCPDSYTSRFIDKLELPKTIKSKIEGNLGLILNPDRSGRGFNADKRVNLNLKSHMLAFMYGNNFRTMGLTITKTFLKEFDVSYVTLSAILMSSKNSEEIIERASEQFHIDKNIIKKWHEYCVKISK